MSRNPLGPILGFIMMATATLMLLPALVDLSDGSDDWKAFTASSVAVGFFGTSLYMATRFEERAHLTVRRGFVLTVVAWIVVPSISALPLLGLGLSYTDAFFETMSGMTTTGSTVLTGIDTLPRGILLWRSLVQWIGGIGIIVMAILMLPRLGIGGMQLFHIERAETSEKVVASAGRLVQNIVVIYAALTAACALLYYLFGMSGFDAICHAMTTLATGGYSTHDSSFAYFNKPGLEWTATVFMVAGACPFVAYIRACQGNFDALFRHPEVRALIAFLALVSLAMAVWLTLQHQVSFLNALRLSAFNVTSIVTTTGFMSSDYAAWGTPAVGVFFILTFIGGCTGSTTGAIKIYRYQIAANMMRRQLKILTSPHRVVPVTYAGKRIDDEIVFSVIAFLTAYFTAFVFVSMALTLTGLDLVTALSGAATALGNVGPGLGPIIGPAGNFAALPDVSKWFLAIAMLLGRLELLAVLVLLHPDFWR